MNRTCSSINEKVSTTSPNSWWKSHFRRKSTEEKVVINSENCMDVFKSLMKAQYPLEEVEKKLVLYKKQCLAQQKECDLFTNDMKHKAQNLNSKLSKKPEKTCIPKDKKVSTCWCKFQFSKESAEKKEVISSENCMEVFKRLMKARYPLDEVENKLVLYKKQCVAQKQCDIITNGMNRKPENLNRKMSSKPEETCSLKDENVSVPFPTMSVVN